MNNKNIRDYILAYSKRHIRKLKESINMIERPTIIGKDAERFIEHVRKNDWYMKERRNLHKALKEVQLIKSGKLPRKTAREFIEEQRNHKK